MKAKHLLPLAAAVLGLTGASASAAVLVSSGALNELVPDDSNTGYASTLNVTDAGILSSVTLNLSLSVPAGQTGWLGDLYATLTHGSGLAVLLNRPGRSSSLPGGYDDGQSFSVTFADGAANGDIHGYRTPLTGSEFTSLSSPLTGNWQADGRTTDPAAVTSGDARPAQLGGFTGVNAAGSWTLFVADVSGGSQYRVDNWSMQMEFTPVPEPATTGAVTALALGGLAIWRRSKGRAKS